MPIRKRIGESKDEFIGRCISIEISNGKSQEQSVAICSAIWEEKQLKAVKNIRKKNQLDKFESNFLKKLSGLGTKMEDLGLKPEDFTGEYQFDLEFIGISEGRATEEEVAYYRYEGPDAERKFCRTLLRETFGRVLSFEDIVSLNSDNPGFGIGGSDTYSVFKYRGGVNCKHRWVKYIYNKTKGELVRGRVQPSQEPVGYVTK
jgi:hypothetical protein